MNEAAQPHRRWFRFSLRTMFVAMTLVGVLLGWLGSNLHQVRQRDELLRSLSSRGAMFGVTRPGSQRTMPYLWHFFGARPVGLIEVPSGTLTQEEQLRLKTLFPETVIADGAPVFDPVDSDF